MVRIPGLKKPKKKKELSDDILERAHKKLAKKNREKHPIYVPLSLIIMFVVAILYMQYSGMYDFGAVFRAQSEPEPIPEPEPEPEPEIIEEEPPRFEVIDETTVRVLDKSCKEIAPQSSVASRESSLYYACVEYCSIAFLGPFNGEKYCTANDLLTCHCG